MSAAIRPFEDVYSDHFSYVYNIIYMHVLHRETAEDLTSETFIRAMSAYDRFDPSISSEKTWLCNIANRLLIDHYRSSARSKSDLAEDEVLNAVPVSDDEMEKLTDTTNQAVYTLLSRLDDEERHLLILRYFMEEKNPDIARELGISAKAVSERYRRLLLKCRKLMDTEELKALL